jgi:lipopolysaccharide export system protein LptC
MFDAAASARPHPLAGTQGWAPRRQLTLEQARKRSLQLSRMRLFFVSASVASFSSIFVFIIVHSLIGGLTNPGEVAASEPQKMLNPRFAGRSATGPYEVTAEVAIRRSMTSDLIDLDKPIYRSRDGRTVNAARGVYDQATGAVRLSGDVIFADSGGYRFESAVARVEGDTGRVIGDRAIHGAGPLGSVRSDGYEISEDGTRITLRGRVKGTLKRGRGDAK